MNIIEIIDNIEYTELYINNQKIEVQEANLNAEFLKEPTGIAIRISELKEGNIYILDTQKIIKGEVDKNDIKELISELEKIKTFNISMLVVEDKIKDTELGKNILEIFKDTPILFGENRYYLTSKLAQNLYLNPQDELEIIAVFGSLGKSTTAQMIQRILCQKYTKVGIISNEIIAIDEKLIREKNDAIPNAVVYNKVLRIMANEGVKIVVIEYSAFDVLKYKTIDTTFEYSVFTNIIRNTYEVRKFPSIKAYIDTYLNIVKQSNFVIINNDDIAKEMIRKNSKKYATYGKINKSKQMAMDIKSGNRKENYLTFIDSKPTRIEVKIPGQESVLNSLAAVTLADQKKLTAEEITEGLKDFVVRGKFEVIDNKEDLSIVIDNARTITQIKDVVKKAKDLTKGLLTIIFDYKLEYAGKEEILGKIFANKADLTIITNLEHEKEEIIDGAKKLREIIRNNNSNAQIQFNRIDAIKQSIDRTQKRDMILLLGVGENNFIKKDDKLIAFNERKIILDYFEEKPIVTDDEKRRKQMKKKSKFKEVLTIEKLKKDIDKL